MRNVYTVNVHVVGICGKNETQKILRIGISIKYGTLGQFMHVVYHTVVATY